MIRLVLIRHGQTDWNVEGRYQGQLDPPLNVRGLAQARCLAEELREVGLDVLYSSPLRRAFQTASVMAGALDLPLYEDARLMEIHQGEWQGVLHADIKTRYAAVFDRWVKEPWTVTLPGGESLAQVQTRVHAALDAIVERHPGHCVGLVAHRIPITLVKIRYQGLDPDAVRTLELPNTYWEEIQVPEKGRFPLRVEFDGNPGLR